MFIQSFSSIIIKLNKKIKKKIKQRKLNILCEEYLFTPELIEALYTGELAKENLNVPASGNTNIVTTTDISREVNTNASELVTKKQKN